MGAETVRADNPRLTVRGIRNGAAAVARGRDAFRPAARQAPISSRIAIADRTLVFRDQSLEAVLAALGQLEITSVLIEGGGDVLGQALDARLIDRVQIYLGPMLTGGPVRAFSGAWRCLHARRRATARRDLREDRPGDFSHREGNIRGVSFRIKE